MAGETITLHAALGLYLASAALALLFALSARPRHHEAFALLGLALLVHGASIIMRWDRVEHGPYVNLFEILSSNVWSLHAAAWLACLFIRPIRPGLSAIIVPLQVLVLWLAVVPPEDADPHITYDTVWLGIHVWLGKLFLGCIVVALGLCLIVLTRKVRGPYAFSAMPRSAALAELAYRFVVTGFLFESLMLVAGAIWAQDAWGRYWAWDPLETWAFITWLGVAAYLHLRSLRPSPTLGSLMVLAVFVLAFSTFFGVPFVSTAPHKGAI